MDNTSNTIANNTAINNTEQRKLNPRVNIKDHSISFSLAHGLENISHCLLTYSVREHTAILAPFFHDSNLFLKNFSSKFSHT